MSIWQKITGAFRHDERRAAPSSEADYARSREPSYEALERDKDRKEALTTGVGYAANNEEPSAVRQFEEDLQDTREAGASTEQGKPFGRDR